MADAILALHLHIVDRNTARRIGLRYYFSGNPCVKGHLDLRMTACGHCMRCERERHYDRHKSLDYRANRSLSAKKRNSTEKAKDAARESYTRNLPAIKARKASPEFRRKKGEYARSDRGKALINASARLRRSGPEGSAKEAARLMIRRCLAAIGGKKTGRTFEILGYTPNDLARHIESLFLSRMGWHNRTKWHIDHIRPAWAKVNLKKSDKWGGQFTLPV